MAKVAYLPMKNFRADTMALIRKADDICEEFRGQGYVLTLRQLYYQFVSRDWLHNTQESYDKLGRIVADARNVGFLDWDAIEDRGRNLRGNQHWANPQQIINAVGAGYALDRWKDQDVRIEVWIEKEALAGVFERICSKLDVPFMACKGYMSQSEIRDAGVRMRSGYATRQRTIVLHFGDHDPSGIDMTRDIGERLSLYARTPIEVQRIALNMDQVEQYEPPPNPAKQTDSRFADYANNYGDESWELDALNPVVLSNLVREHVGQYRDEEVWAETIKRESDEKALLQVAGENWGDTAKLLRRKFGEEVDTRADGNYLDAIEESSLEQEEE